MANTKFTYSNEIMNGTTRILRMIAPNNDNLYVGAFENGIATIKPSYACSIREFAEYVAGCFDEESNFSQVLFNAFNVSVETDFIGVTFEINGVTFLVTKENADADKIYAEYQEKMHANAEKYRLEREAYMKTPEYQIERAKALKMEERIKAIEKEVILIDETTELQFKDKEAKDNWIKWVQINLENHYSYGIVTYARCWGKYMQHLMVKHNKTVAEIAANASIVCDMEGLSPAMYGYAVNILIQCWKYGDELRKWHNKEWGLEDADGVVNPAVLTF